MSASIPAATAPPLWITPHARTGSGSDRSFNPDSIIDLQAVLESSLQKVYFIRVNRDLTILFQRTAIVGQQDLMAKTANFDHGRGVGDIADAIFDACMVAKQMDQKEPA
jgi:hypothetical protein